jgi:outer membrane protein assembly factor BamB
VLLTASARAATVHGLVFEDSNGDGLPSPGEPPIAHAVVAFDATTFVETDAAGNYSLEVDGPGFVWLRGPEGFAPHPVWGEYAGKGDATIDLGARRAKPTSSTFVIGSDAHLGIASAGATDLATAISEATAGDPAFFAIVGDVTQGGTDAEFDAVGASLLELGDVPWVPVAGNHDWYDNGVVWGQRVGPDNYSFDRLGVHFLVWNMALDEQAIVAFLRGDLARVKTPIVALTHAPPSPRILDELARLHVGYVLTGHAHSNRVVHHAGVTEFNTEPLLMGGLDFTPAGYRIVQIAGDKLSTRHHTTVDRPFLSIVAPAHGQCTPRAHGELLVAAELDASTATITARVDCATPIALRAVGGWDWRAELPNLAPGAHQITVEARAASGVTTTTSSAIEVCDPASGPSMQAKWVTAVGGHILSASPAVANHTVYVTVTDLADGNAGGVVALDAATGAIEWRAATEIQVRGGVAVVGEIVVVPRIDGVILGLDATTGAQRWSYTLRANTAPEAAATFASVTADGPDVMIGHQRAFAVLDAADGHPRWHNDPVPEGENSQSLAAVAVGDGLVVGTFNRLFGGVQAWDRATGAPRWQLDSDDTVGINATPVIADHTVFIVDAADQVTAIDAATGWVKWRAPLDEAGFEWGNATIGRPAYADGILIVPTLYRDLVALDATTGVELWRHPGLPSSIRTTHYRGAREAGYEASPVILGDRVWIADTSGELAALELRTGKPLFRANIGAPVLAGLAVDEPGLPRRADDRQLIVASFDGTVRAYGPGTERPYIAPTSCTATPSGCATSSPSLFAALLVVAFALTRSRRC